MKIYVSCPIRGIRVSPENYGTPEADKIIKQNCLKAMALASTLRQHLIGTEVHCPANLNLETFVSVAYKKDYLTEKQILDVDCHIIADSDLVIFYNHEKQMGKGMKVEFDYTLELNKTWTAIEEAHQVKDCISMIKMMQGIKE